MNSDQITGVIRAIVPVAIAMLASKGLDLTASTDVIVAAIAALFAAAWSIHNNRTGKIIK